MLSDKDQNAATPPAGKKRYRKELMKYLHYPDGAIKLGAEGTVYISANVGKGGLLSDVVIEKDEIGHGCGEEAVKAIQKMPPWIPAKVNGKFTEVRITIPVEFRLRDLSRFHSRWYLNIWRRIEVWIIVIIIILYVFVRTHIFSLYH